MVRYRFQLDWPNLVVRSDKHHRGVIVLALVETAAEHRDHSTAVVKHESSGNDLMPADDMA